MKKQFYKLCLTALISGVTVMNTLAQSGPVSLGKTSDFIGGLKSKTSTANLKAGSKPLVSQKVSDKESLTLKVNYKNSASGEVLMGEVNGQSGSNFYIKSNGATLEGNIVLMNQKKAYEYYSENGNAFLKEVDIHDLVCIEYDHADAPAPAPSSPEVAFVPTDLQSFPGANGCVLLDYDGHYMPAGNLWNGGNAINAAHSGMSDAAVRESWEIVSEDFRPFSLNVTTSEAVFNSYPRNRRMRCVITPTNTAAPGAGGVAYIGSFNWDNDVPCWTFITSAKGSAEASSHEIGHTFGLGHDGRNNPAEGYFAGHGDWAPIMGVGYYRNISQWSRGEYNSANNLEDDLAKISSSTYGVGYRNDDHSNSTAGATSVAAGNVNRYGIIERTSDFDFFTFVSGSGTINLNVNTVSRHGDLDIRVRLHNSSGAVIGTYNPAGLNASLSANVSQGTYYISVDGVGAGNPATDGYSDYASLGQYWVTGNIPVPSNPQPDNAVVTVYKDCNYGGYAIGLAEGDYTLAQLQARGISNDDISSLRVDYGYKIRFFADDNFTGSSVLLNADDACLVDNGFNDNVSSLRIRPDGATNLAGTYLIQNRASNLVMDVADWGTGNGARILQWNNHGGANQQFELVHLGDGVYRIISKHSGRSLDVLGISKADGANIVQWDYAGGDNQKFIVKGVGDGFYKLIAKHSGKIVEIGGGSTTPGAAAVQWGNHNLQHGNWRFLTIPSNPVSTVIQAESYSAMAGVQTEATTDAGGGLNVGWIDTGDWMAYNSINFPSSGTYTVEYRVASMSGGGRISLDLNAGAIVLGALNVPSTGGWQNWTTISHTVNVPNAGTYNLGIFASAGGFNLNWIRITKSATAAAITQAAKAQLLETTFEYYPNPAEENMIVRSEIELNGGIAKIYDALGSEVISTSVEAETVNVASLSPGIYTLVIHVDGTKVSRRFVKK